MSRDSAFGLAARELEYELAAVARPRGRAPYGRDTHRKFEGEAFDPSPPLSTDTMVPGFAPNSSWVTPAQRKIINWFALYVITIMPRTPSNNLLVIHVKGHEDETGDPSQFNELSWKRAEAVQAILEPRIRDYMSRFLKPAARRSFEFIAIGMGPSSPIRSNATAAGRAMNRRVELGII